MRSALFAFRVFGKRVVLNLRVFCGRTGLQSVDKSYAYEISLGKDSAAARTLSLVGHAKSVLEIGCASGSQSKILAEQMECAVTGVEINVKAAEAARPYCKNLIVGDIEQMDVADRLSGEKFDVVLFADVLEHLYNPLGALRKLLACLKGDGYVVACIPNIVQISVIHGMIHGEFEYRKSGILDDTHIRFFTRRSVFDLFTNAGLVIDHFDRWPIDIRRESVFYPRDESDRAVVEYIRTHNPECLTSHFIIAASVHNADDDLNRRQARAEIASLEKLALQKEAGACASEATIRRLAADVAWLQRGFLRRVLGRLRR